MPGVAINPVTHQALMTADKGNQIALLKLPSNAVKQLKATKVSGVNSTIPKDPNGNDFIAAAFPYGTATDSCNNLGYVMNDVRSFIAQIDLKKLQKDPAAISTALPPGSCSSIATTSQCDNGNGLKFYPVPAGSSSAASLKLSAEFSDDLHHQKNNVKSR
jgi:hypothetical protein